MKASSKSITAAELTARLEANAVAAKPVRGIPVNILQEYGVRTALKDGRLLFPLVDSKGFLHRVKWRFVEKREGQQSFGSHRCTEAPAPLFGMKAASNDRALYITEGELDAMSIRAMIPNVSAVSIPDGAASALQAIDNHLSWVTGFGTVFVAFDADEAGLKATEEVITKYPEFKRVIMPTGFKDANDVLRAGKDAIESFKKATYQAKSQTPSYIDEWDDIVKGVCDDLDDPQKAVGVDTGLYPINALLGGWREAETSCIFAPPGKGKSTMCRTIAYQQAKRGVKSVVVSTEESAKTWVRKLTVIHTKRLDKEAVAETAEFLKEHVTFLNPDSLGEPDALINAIDVTVRSKNAFFILFDNITHYAKSLQGSYWDTIRYMTNKLVSLVKRRSCHVLTIGHITKAAARADEPNLGDADGGNAISQFYNNVIHIDRYKAPKEEDEDAYVPAQPDMTTVMTLLKRREEPYGVELPSIGSKEFLTYVPRTNTYLELSSAPSRRAPEASKPAEQANVLGKVLDVSEALAEVTEDVLAVEPDGEVKEAAKEEIPPKPVEVEVTPSASEEKDHSAVGNSGSDTKKQGIETSVPAEPELDTPEMRQQARAERIRAVLNSRANSSGNKQAGTNKGTKPKPSVPPKRAAGSEPQPGLRSKNKNWKAPNARMQERWKRLREERKVNTAVVQGIIQSYRDGSIKQLPWVTGQVPLSDSVITPTGEMVQRLDGYQLAPPASFRKATGMAVDIDQKA